MKQHVQQMSIAVVTTALVLGVSAPAVFAATVEVSGNGNNSQNTVAVSGTNYSGVTQGTTTTASTRVRARANTGRNTASNNTNGDVSIETGKAAVETAVDVMGGNNQAPAPDCGCATPNHTVDVVNNGTESTNTVALTQSDINQLVQGTVTDVLTRVRARVNTGRNRSNDNTGGSVSIVTEDASATTGVVVTSGHNTVN